MLIPRNPRRQRGVASLLFVLIASVGLVATAMAALYTSKGAQKIQYSQHTAAQAQMNAWTGVNAISSAIAAMSTAPTLTPGGAVQLAGLPSSIAATYVTTQNGFMVFDVKGSSRGATTTLRAAYAFSLPSTSSSTSGAYVNSGSGMVLHGNTTMSGSTTYTGSAPANVYIIGGGLTLSGGTNGIRSVCATGDISMSGSASVASVCTDGNLSMSGGSVVGSSGAPGFANVRGFVKGGSIWGNINSNSWVTLSGSAINTPTINATGDVTVDGLTCRQRQHRRQHRLERRRRQEPHRQRHRQLHALGQQPVDGHQRARQRDAHRCAQRQNQRQHLADRGSGLGVQGALSGAGSLNWSNSGAVVGSGTVGGAKLGGTGPNVRVTDSSGHTPAVPAFTMPSVVTFTPNNLVVGTVDPRAEVAGQLRLHRPEDPQGNPRVTDNYINGVDDGDYFVAKKNTAPTSENWLCKGTTNNNCDTPLVRIRGVNGAPEASASPTATASGPSRAPCCLRWRGSRATWAYRWAAVRRSPR